MDEAMFAPRLLLLFLLILIGTSCHSETSHRRQHGAFAHNTPKQVSNPEARPPSLQDQPTTTLSSGAGGGDEDTNEQSAPGQAEQLVSFEVEAAGDVTPSDDADPLSLPQFVQPEAGEQVDETIGGKSGESLVNNRYVIDLPTVLRLSGTDNWGRPSGL